MKLFDAEYEISRHQESGFYSGEVKYYYTIQQRNKSFFVWGNWYRWKEATTLCGGFETYINKRYDTLQQAEQAIPKGGKIVRKPLK